MTLLIVTFRGTPLEDTGSVTWTLVKGDLDLLF